MRYISIKPYTHHRGTIVKLTEIPEDTLIQRSTITDTNPGMEYVTLGFGDDGQYYLSESVVEGSPEYFQPLTEEEFWQEISKRELINQVILNEERGISPLESIQIISDQFDLELVNMEDYPQPNENLRDAADRFKKFMDELNTFKEQYNKPFSPTVPNMPQTFPTAPQCHCGNDGTKPCWSTACPNRLIITYCTTSTGGHTINHIYTTIEDKNK